MKDILFGMLALITLVRLSFVVIAKAKGKSTTQKTNAKNVKEKV